MARGIQEAALRAAELTRSLLGVARGGSVEPQHADVGAVLADVARIAHETFDRRITTIVRADADLPAVAVAASELHRAVLNLAINARDALPAGGETRAGRRARRGRAAHAGARRRRRGPWVRIDVRDTGVGMPQAVRARLFEPFFTTKPRGKGTGLGLYGVYQFLRAFGGAVEVDSQVGAGTTFRVYLPRAGPPPATPRRPGAAPEPARAADVGARILVVEDEEAVRRVAATLLRAAGHDVTEASDGEEAVRRFAADPAASTSSCSTSSCPGCPGRRSCGASGRSDRTSRSCSRAATSRRGSRTRRSGRVSGVLPKPYLPADLHAAVRSALAPKAPAGLGHHGPT